MDQVNIEPNGKWSATAAVKPSPRPSNGRASSDAEDDLIEIQDAPQLASVKSEISRELGMMRTPPISSREQSTSSAAPPSGSKKRLAGQVVDLTNSSDEDEEPIRAPKRHATQSFSNGLSSIPGLETMPMRPNDMTASFLKQPQYHSNTVPTPNYASNGFGQQP